MGTVALLSGECVFFLVLGRGPSFDDYFGRAPCHHSITNPCHILVVHTMFSYSLHRSMGGPWGGEPEETLGDPMDVHGGR